MEILCSSNARQLSTEFITRAWNFLTGLSANRATMGRDAESHEVGSLHPRLRVLEFTRSRIDVPVLAETTEPVRAPEFPGPRAPTEVEEA